MLHSSSISRTRITAPYGLRRRVRLLPSFSLLLVLFVGTLLFFDPGSFHPFQAGMSPRAAAAQGQFSCSTVTEIPQIECRALAALYEKTNGSNWADNRGWLADTSPCSWYGVTCVANRVTSLQLPGNGLVGQLPVELGALLSLQVLDLSAAPPAVTVQSATKREQAALQPLLERQFMISDLIADDAADFYHSQVEARMVISSTARIATDDMTKAEDPAVKASPVAAAKPTVAASRTLTATSDHLRTLLATLPPDWAGVAATGADELPHTAASSHGAATTQAAGLPNVLTGPLPTALGNLRNLQRLNLQGNQLSGPIPAELGLLQSLTYLNLFSNALEGEIPPALGQLVNLQMLDLGVNQLSGTIPPELGNFPYLTALGLCGNSLSGPIPSQLGQLTNLSVLVLCYNQLDGPIPATLGQLRNLQMLRLDVNRLSGSIPTALGTLPQLQYLRLEENQLSGTIPPELGNLPNLLVLFLHSNRLSGSIPDALRNLSNLILLNLSDNWLSGLIPPSLGTLTNLRMLSLGINQLHGPIPPELGNLQGLTLLGITYSQLTGPIPSTLANLQNMESFSLFENRLTGTIPAFIFSWPALRELNLNNNQFSGPLPAALTAQQSLEQLILYNNQLSGPLPAAIGNLTNLNRLLIATNHFDGPLPAGLGNLQQLTDLWLSENEFTGSIPAELGQLSALQSLWLYSNHLSGPLPASLSNLTQLQVFFASGNQLTGTIPPTWANLASLQALDLGANRLQGAIPPELGNLTNLRWLFLYNNLLSGPIPSELGQLTNLHLLFLWSNRLTGTIPPSLGNLMMLEQLDLSNNQLRDNIPLALTQLTDLHNLDLSLNVLSGAIPPELANLTKLTNLMLRANLFSGPIPPELGELTQLRQLWLDTNQLSGPLPPALGQLKNLVELQLYGNQLTGTIPAAWGGLANLEWLELDHNRFRGPIPAELGNLSYLQLLDLSHNGFNGPLPPELRFLQLLTWIDLRYNQLTVNDSALATFLAERAPNWAATQTVAPTELQAAAQRSDAIALSWEPIAYGADGGFYEVEFATAAEGPFALHGRTIDKRSPGYTAEGLAPNTTYWFHVRTVTPARDLQNNHLVSDYPPVLSATTTAQTTVGDSYEQDDSCTAARTLVTDGRSAEHTFHQPTDQDWIHFTTQISRTYRIDVQVPEGSQADVTLKLFDGCSDGDPLTLDQSFSPGVQFTFVAPQSGAYYLQLTNTQAASADANLAYRVSIRATGGETGSGAVILLAGRLAENDGVQPNIENGVARFYQMLLDNGYTDDTIYYLSTETTRIGVDGPSTAANLQYAINTWARDRVDTEHGLTLYLFDHGDANLLYLDGPNHETLTPAQLDEWLTQLETVRPNIPVNVLIEACYSGSFVRNRGGISKPGRVIITSTSLHNLAYASQTGAHFSDHLLTALRQGHHLFSSFWEARIATRQVTTLAQDPWLDADGDGRPNELEDAAIAARRTLFSLSAQATSTLWPPYIATALVSGGENRTYAMQADVRDNDAVARVWAVIYPPDYMPPTDGNELVREDLPQVELRGVAGQYAVDYTFPTTGQYRVAIHAEDNDGLRARPVMLTIDTAAPIGSGTLDGDPPAAAHQLYVPIVAR